MLLSRHRDPQLCHLPPMAQPNLVLCLLQVVLGGLDLGLCIVCPPIHPKVVLHTSCQRWGCRGLPTSSINPLVSAPSRARPWALLYTSPRLLSSSFCNWEWRPSSWGKESLGGGAQPCLPSSFLHPGCCFGPAATPNSLLSGSLPCSPPAHAFYYEETCTHFNPRAGAGGARMDE